MPVSFALIARNEEAKLGACLQSIAGLAGEIVVVDTGSSDRTREVAARLGAKVFDFPWVEDFAAARNECLRHATGDYIFWMDADEVIDEVNREKLRALFETLPPVTDGSSTNGHRLLAYAMKCRCLPDPQSGIATVVDHIRLFPNHPQIRWKYRVHEQILPALNQLGIPVVGTDIVIDHTGYQDPGLVQRKTERNLRLLELDYADHPEDPFILFNLGWTYLTMGQAAKALGFLRQSLERSNPGDSIVRKIYGLLAQAHLRLGQPGEALAACRAGRARYPQDDELLMMQGRLLEGSGNLAGAEACYRQLVVVSEENCPRIDTNRHEERKENNHGEHGQHGETNQGLPPTTHDSPLTPHFLPAQFLSVEEGLRGYKARFHLAMAYQRQGKDKEAEEQLQAVVAERPEFAPAWLELARLYFSQTRWPELDEVVDRLLLRDRPRIEDGESKESPLVVPALAGKQDRLKAELQTASDSRSSILDSRSSVEAGVLKARGLLARKEFSPARQILEEIIAHNPQWPYPRVILSYVFLQQEDLAGAERVLRDLLVLDPAQVEAWMNLAKLLRSQRRIPEALVASRSGTVHCPNDLDLPWLHGTLLHEAGDLIGAEACFLAVASGPPELANGSAELSSRARERYISARHQLALIYRELRRPSDAESQWREVLAECPDHAAARQGLLDLRHQHASRPLPESVAT
jgi:tetratricopeptide (TPR) repeat protein